MMKSTHDARWITCPKITGCEYGVYHFRKTILIEKVLTEYKVKLSADNRYELFVNGTFVCFGPVKSDIAHYQYDLVDIMPFLNYGVNVIAVTVWNYGEFMPLTQISCQTAFYMQGATQAEQQVHSNTSWKVMKNNSYTPITDTPELLGTYFVVPPGEEIDSSLYPWGWETPQYNDTSWLQAVTIDTDTTNKLFWQLEPRSIPFMESKQIRFTAIRNQEPLLVNQSFIEGKSELVIPANSKLSFLLDNGYLTNAFPVLTTSFGKGSHIKLTYNEALYDDKKQKSHRDHIEGMTLLGMSDVYLLNGGAARTYRPLSYRTYRYASIDVTTADEPLTIHDFYSMFTAYPFAENASFDCDNADLKSIWDVSWRTARLCAHETYMDCPYYEQAQYLGDTRIQCFISLYVSGDDRLMRQALEIFRSSIKSDGLTMCAYPANGEAKIPPFSLFWINMIHDYWMLRKDDAFVTSFFNEIEGILKWFEERIDQSCYLLGELTHWNFVDWAWPYNPKSNIGGIPSGANNGEKHSALMTLQYVYALLAAASLFSAYGENEKSAYYLKLAEKLNFGVLQNCWDENRGLLADTPDKNEFSKHTNIFGILTDCINNDVIEKIITDKSLRDVTLYFRFYLNRALKKSGRSEAYMTSLSSWTEMLSYGFTTFPEINDYIHTRSDCHAWSASPLYDFLTIIAGIEPLEPGFKSILIAPSFNGLKCIKASMPHPNGTITVHIKNENASVSGTVELPPNTFGQFKWNGFVLDLKEGIQTINL